MKQILAIVVLAFAASPMVLSQTMDKKAAEDSKVEQVLKKLEHGWLERLTDPETRELDRFLADEWTFINPGGAVQDKTGFLGAIKSGDLKYESHDADDIKVRLYGNTAVVTGRYTLTGRYKGQSFNSQVRYTNVYVKRQERWQVVAQQATRIAQ